MPDSSSSDSEDDTKFREACDPTLAAKYEKRGENEEEDNKDIDKEGNTQKIASTNLDDADTEMSESFLLLQKVKKSMATLQTKKGCALIRPIRGDAGGGGGVVGGRTSIVLSHSTSTLSPYLAKQLSTILDRNVNLTTKKEYIPKSEGQKTRADQSSVCLLRNMKFEPEENYEDERRKRKRKANKAQRKSAYFDSSDEEEVVTRCCDVAVTPHWLLNNAHSTPPHPKNTRYLYEYVMRERRDDGSIVAHVREEAGDAQEGNITAAVNICTEQRGTNTAVQKRDTTFLQEDITVQKKDMGTQPDTVLQEREIASQQKYTSSKQSVSASKQMGETLENIDSTTEWRESALDGASEQTSDTPGHCQPAETHKPKMPNLSISTLNNSLKNGEQVRMNGRQNSMGPGNENDIMPSSKKLRKQSRKRGNKHKKKAGSEAQTKEI